MTLKEIFVGKTENTSIQIIRNVIVELSRIGLNMLILWLTYQVIMHEQKYLIEFFSKEIDVVLISCTIIASMLSGIANFVFSTIWVFHKKQKNNNILRFIVFTIIGAIGLAINSAITYFFTNSLGVHFLVSNLIAQVIVFFFNFVMRKKIVYTLMSKEKEEITKMSKENQEIAKMSKENQEIYEIYKYYKGEEENPFTKGTIKHTLWFIEFKAHHFEIKTKEELHNYVTNMCYKWLGECAEKYIKEYIKD